MKCPNCDDGVVPEFSHYEEDGIPIWEATKCQYCEGTGEIKNAVI
jgi:Zn ribbon nucleic-acid-binding protein